MQEPQENKMLKPQENKAAKKDTVKKKFFYPDRQITVEAETKEAADEELQTIINQK